MDPIVREWIELVVRWIHVITGIAWIGASFYFNWLLNHLMAPARDDKEASSELWALHAGGFFNVQKRSIAPGGLPEPLHWFKWEAYWTWISGFVLLVLVYYLGAKVYLVDRGVADISATTAVLIGLAVLVASWFAYDFLWRSPLAQNAWLAAAISFALVILLAFGLSLVFSGRGTYIHIGAMLGTLMVGNVFRVIMPAQRELVAATQEGRPQDPTLSAYAEQRSLHNNYMTLPVLFIMVSNHYPSTFGHHLNWLVLAVLFVVGAAVRYYFNIRHKQGNVKSAWLLVASAAAVAGLAFVTAPPKAQVASSTAVAFAQIDPIFKTHCVTCHSAKPTDEAFEVAPKGVMFDTAEQILDKLELIRAQAVDSDIMPLGNMTEMTPEERALLGQWITEGGKIE